MKRKLLKSIKKQKILFKHDLVKFNIYLLKDKKYIFQNKENEF